MNKQNSSIEILIKFKDFSIGYRRMTSDELSDNSFRLIEYKENKNPVMLILKEIVYNIPKIIKWLFSKF